MGISTTSPSRRSRTGSRASSISWARNTPRSATRSAAARCSPTTLPRGCAPPSPSTNRSRRADGEASRTAPADQVRPEHAQDHQDDGARRHLQAEARAGSGDRGAAVRGGARRGDRRPVRARAGGALPTVAPAGRHAAPRSAGAPHREPRAVRRVQRQPDPGSAAAARGARARRRGGGPAPRRQEGHHVLQVREAAGGVDAVEVVFAQFKSAVATPPTVARILPVEPLTEGRKDGTGMAGGSHSVVPSFRRSANYILRPSADAILAELLPLSVRNQMYRALVETAAAFYGAQRTAMKNATDNAGDMLDILRRTYNRARQAQITQELAEIVGGAEALRG